MNGPQTIVGLGGVGLIAANYWTRQRKPVVQVLQNTGAANLAQAHSVIVEIGGELLFVAVAVVLAGTSQVLGELLVVVIVGLAILFGINYAGSSSSTAAAPASTGTVAGMTQTPKKAA